MFWHPFSCDDSRESTLLLEVKSQCAGVVQSLNHAIQTYRSPAAGKGTIECSSFGYLYVLLKVLLPQHTRAPILTCLP